MQIKIRIMHDTKQHENNWWAEELVGERWLEVHGTRMSCEGNTRSCVEKYIEKRKMEQYKLYVKQVGEEVTFEI